MAMNEVTLFDRFDDPEGTINLGHGGLEQTYIEKASKMFKEGVEQMMVCVVWRSQPFPSVTASMGLATSD